MEKILFTDLSGEIKARNASREIKMLAAEETERALNLSDINKSLVCDVTTQMYLNLTLTPDIAFPLERWELGTEIEFINANSGQISLFPDTNVSVIAYGNPILTLLGIGAVANIKLIKQNATTDTWLAVGYF